MYSEQLPLIFSTCAALPGRTAMFALAFTKRVLEYRLKNTR